jgi:hypothetical protein
VRIGVYGESDFIRKGNIYFVKPAPVALVFMQKTKENGESAPFSIHPLPCLYKQFTSPSLLIY